MSQIVTFYSDRHAQANRSAALVRVAILLAERSLRVLLVDWDFQSAPLERGFGDLELVTRGDGLLSMLATVDGSRAIDYRRYVSTISGRRGHSGEQWIISLLSRDRLDDNVAQGSDDGFDWDRFYATGGGGVLETLREHWRDEYDIVLIDSAGGRSAASAICLIQLPDVAVAILSPSSEGFYGVRETLRRVQVARQDFAYDRMQLAVIPVASGFKSDPQSNSFEDVRWDGEAMSEFTRVWTPASVKQSEVLQRLTIPQPAPVGAGEAESIDPSDREQVVYERVSGLLAGNFDLAERVLELGRFAQARQSAAEADRAQRSEGRATAHPGDHLARRTAQDLRLLQSFTEEGSGTRRGRGGRDRGTTTGSRGPVGISPPDDPEPPYLQVVSDPYEPAEDAEVQAFDAELEARDLHEGDEAGAWERAMAGATERDVATVLKTLQIAENQTSKIFDYRGSTSPNGGRIDLRACVHHIPVINNVDGRPDIDLLRQVLLDRGVMVQFGTDAVGNVAVFARANRLCFHAKGANSITCGVQHLHLAVGDPWSRKQVRAAAWIAQFLEREFDIPLRVADVEPNGPGRVQIMRKGHTTHRKISHEAGFDDRIDPGAGFDFERVFAAARFFSKHGHFVGA